MQKDAGTQKTNKKTSVSKPDGPKPKAIKCKKTLVVKKPNKNPWQPKQDGLKPMEIKCKKTLEFKKQTKIHRCLDPTALNQKQ